MIDLFQEKATPIGTSKKHALPLVVRQITVGSV